MKLCRHVLLASLHSYCAGILEISFCSDIMGNKLYHVSAIIVFFGTVLSMIFKRQFWKKSLQKNCEESSKEYTCNVSLCIIFNGLLKKCTKSGFWESPNLIICVYCNNRQIPFFKKIITRVRKNIAYAFLTSFQS